MNRGSWGIKEENRSGWKRTNKGAIFKNVHMRSTAIRGTGRQDVKRKTTRIRGREKPK